jgi:hypothetical protein
MSFLRLATAVTFGTAVCGCSLIANYTSFNQRLLVKVRSDLRPDETVSSARRESDVWHFRHVVEAPRDPKNRGDWYVAWRTKDLGRTRALTFPQFLWRRWVWAKNAAPSLADATHHAFGVYPLMIEPDLVFFGIPSQHHHDNAESVTQEHWATDTHRRYINLHHSTQLIGRTRRNPRARRARVPARREDLPPSGSLFFARD